MFNKSQYAKDEREIAVENASYSLAYKIIIYAVLVDVIYRSLVYKQQTLDLLGIVIFGGAVATVYQFKYRLGSKNTVKLTMLVTLIATIVAAVIVFLSK